MITALFYDNNSKSGETIQLKDLTYKAVLAAMGLNLTDDVIEQFPWPDKPYAMLSLESGNEGDVVRSIDDLIGFTWEIAGPILFLRSEICDDDYSSLSEEDIDFIKQMVSEEVQ